MIHPKVLPMLYCSSTDWFIYIYYIYEIKINRLVRWQTDSILSNVYNCWYDLPHVGLTFPTIARISHICKWNDLICFIRIRRIYTPSGHYLLEVNADTFLSLFWLYDLSFFVCDKLYFFDIVCQHILRNI